jgi:hypothetical protein
MNSARARLQLDGKLAGGQQSKTTRGNRSAERSSDPNGGAPFTGAGENNFLWNW